MSKDYTEVQSEIKQGLSLLPLATKVHMMTSSLLKDLNDKKAARQERQLAYEMKVHLQEKIIEEEQADLRFTSQDEMKQGLSLVPLATKVHMMTSSLLKDLNDKKAARQERQLEYERKVHLQEKIIEGEQADWRLTSQDEIKQGLSLVPLATKVHMMTSSLLKDLNDKKAARRERQLEYEMKVHLQEKIIEGEQADLRFTSQDEIKQGLSLVPLATKVHMMTSSLLKDLNDKKAARQERQLAYEMKVHLQEKIIKEEQADLRFTSQDEIKQGLSLVPLATKVHMMTSSLLKDLNDKKAARRERQLEYEMKVHLQEKIIEGEQTDLRFTSQDEIKQGLSLVPLATKVHMMTSSLLKDLNERKVKQKWQNAIQLQENLNKERLQLQMQHKFLITASQMEKAELKRDEIIDMGHDPLDMQVQDHGSRSDTQVTELTSPQNDKKTNVPIKPATSSQAA